MVDAEPVARRVKLYKLNQSGQWDDGGTGHVDYNFIDASVVITVTAEDADQELLTHKVTTTIEYQRQVLLFSTPPSRYDSVLIEIG
jgi:hypothetical protein